MPRDSNTRAFGGRAPAHDTSFSDWGAAVEEEDAENLVSKLNELWPVKEPRFRNNLTLEGNSISSLMSSSEKK